MTDKRFQVHKVIGSFHEWSIEDIIDDEVVFGSIMHKYEADRLCTKLNELNDEINVLDAKIERLIRMLDNVANYMQRQNKDVPLDDFVEWWNKIATEGLDD